MVGGSFRSKKKKAAPPEATVSPPRTDRLINPETSSVEQAPRGPGSPSTSCSDRVLYPAARSALPPDHDPPDLRLWTQTVTKITDGSRTDPPPPTTPSMAEFVDFLRFSLRRVRLNMWFGWLRPAAASWAESNRDGEQLLKVSVMARSLSWIRIRDEAVVEKGCPADLIDRWVLDLENKQELVDQLKSAAAFASTIAATAKNLGSVQREGSKMQRVCEIMVNCLFLPSARLFQQLFKMLQKMPATQEPQGDEEKADDP